jgi:hypothetical protein
MDSTRSSIFASKEFALKRKRALSWLSVTTFFMVLLLPVLAMCIGFAPVADIDENRRLAPVPTLKGTLPSIIDAAQKWFDDHFGLRPLFIRLKTQIDYSLFGVSDRVYVGHDGFLFYRLVLDEQRFAIERFLRDRNADVVRGAQRLSDHLRLDGRRLVVLIAPSKEIIYPEMVPATAPSFPRPSQIELLRAQLQHLPGVIFVDPTDMLRELKRHRLVYYRTDPHWNTPAGYEVGKLLVDRLALEEGWPNSPWIYPLELERKRFVGAEAKFMPLIFPPGEEAIFAKITWPNHPGVRYKVNDPPFAYWQWVPTEVKGLLPCLVVVGDSFWLGMQAPAAMHFQGYYQATWSDTMDFSDVIMKTPKECKYVLYQFVQSNLPALKTLADFKAP